MEYRWRKKEGIRCPSKTRVPKGKKIIWGPAKNVGEKKGIQEVIEGGADYADIELGKQKQPRKSRRGEGCASVNSGGHPIRKLQKRQQREGKWSGGLITGGSEVRMLKKPDGLISVCMGNY